ncbi:hypothetical protein EUTSA_v10025860mg [Eutrema salsugineum]|uniref:RING-type E3 ubiquitin transferase n=1 Tax=Eutrema salsugineum TaxID=72664 RepID=V4LYT6_EUTSA|nr:hypothetical protein EUTSA_v10025860mg [Eutrema salsugineum]
MSFRDPNPVTTTPGTNSDPAGFAINSRIMLTAIIIILFVVILMISLHLYSRWYLLRSRRFHLRRFDRRNRAAAAIIYFADPSSTTAVVTTTRGLDPSVIKSLPVFTFSAANANAIDCAVCLSEFEDNETGRVLPNCKHVFHVECIDMWFRSHTSCPLCRSLVEPVAGEVKSTVEEVAISISDPVSGDDQGSRPEICDTDRVGEAGAHENSDPGDSRRKPAAIEIPKRNLGELENDLTRSNSFRSPMSRVISFTRILSRERRSASSSSSIGFPSVVSPPACSMPVTDLDIDFGGEDTR